MQKKKVFPGYRFVSFPSNRKTEWKKGNNTWQIMARKDLAQIVCVDICVFSPMGYLLGENNVSVELLSSIVLSSVFITILLSVGHPISLWTFKKLVHI